MGIKNYLIEGVSGTGKTTVAEELQRRGYHVLHGDRELAYWGDARLPTIEALLSCSTWQDRWRLRSASSKGHPLVIDRRLASNGLAAPKRFGHS